MNGNCDQAMEQVGLGVSASLRAVDCIADDFSQQAFANLLGPGGISPAVTSALVIFVALFAIALLMGRTNLSVRSITPRMITMAVVITFATTGMYLVMMANITAISDYLATLVLGGDESATQTFGDKIDVVFLAVQEASGQQTDISAFSPAGLLWLGAMLFLLATVGVLVTTRIALAVLIAVGPVFIIMALFPAARGMFVGWLKGVVMLALVPLFAVLGGGVMLELAIPVLSELTATPGQINPQPAAAFFLIGAVHAALMVMVSKVAGTMVSSWTVFGLANNSDDRRASDQVARPLAASPYAAPAATAAAAAASGATLSGGPSRRIDVSAVPTAPPANDAGFASGGAEAAREVRVFATSSGDGQPRPTSTGPSRASGIGSRFKAAPPRVLEKMK